MIADLTETGGSKRTRKGTGKRKHDVRMSLDEALSYALGLLSRGHGAEALKIYEMAASLVPDRADLVHFHGVALHQSGDTARGLALTERSLTLEPMQAGWWNNHGNILREMGRLDDAIDSFKRATEIASDFAEPYNNLGIVQRDKKNLDISEACFKQAIKLNPDFADAYSNYGNLLVARQQTAEGVNLLLKALTLRPESASSKRSLGYAYGQLGEFDKARSIYMDWLKEEPDNPIALHHLAAVSGEISGRASDNYVRQVFDAFAPSFDTKLANLDYRAPALVNGALLAAVAGTGGALVVADAGCGTGLCGPGLRGIASSLIGVDLSSVMLAHARERGCYDALHEAELTAFLSASGNSFDSVISADTLCYFGDLTAVFAATASSLRPGGWFVFTVEELAAGGPDIKLNHHGRYAHSRAYVEQALSDAGFVVNNVAHEVLRNESGFDVVGLVVVAARAESPN